ncbi:hypothetical protein HYU11_03100 [Candidatus Woesearchaeota archaeon]|nr:hypothetical protein [Candidatus Woesearchaeota archaeon]
MKYVWLFLVILVAGCQANNPGQESADELAASLEGELSTALKSGGISPEEYARIDKGISNLEDSGFSPERINSLRVTLSQLQVGGQRVEEDSVNKYLQLKAPFSEIQREVLDAESKGGYLEAVRYNDILDRLEDLRVQGYPSSEIDSLITIISQLKPPKKKGSWEPPSSCSGHEVIFTSSPVRLEDIHHIVPLGQMAGSHVTPTDHGYIINSDEKNVFPVDLFSPADGYVLEIGAFDTPNNYRLVLWHSCTVATIYIHVYELAPEILAVTGNIPPGGHWAGEQGPKNARILPIQVKAGQFIGKIKGGVDFSVHDTSVNLSGFVTPSLYDAEPWKVHTVDLFGYFAGPLKSNLEAMSLRRIPPVGGKIDYDIDGRLVGNWFIEGTDYKGNSTSCNYYECHLAIAYNNVNPENIRISFPNSGIKFEDCRGCVGSYPVRSNKPDPATVGVETGLVKYELISLERDGASEDKILGTFLVQMISGRRIKAEFLLGKKAAEVSGFSGSEKTYHRDSLVTD